MSNLILFENKHVRRVWSEEKQRWFFSIIDVCEILSGTDNPRRYWSDLKRKLKNEGVNELYEIIVQLKIEAEDGKMRETAVRDELTEEWKKRGVKEQKEYAVFSKKAKALLLNSKTVKLLRAQSATHRTGYFQIHPAAYRGSYPAKATEQAERTTKKACRSGRTEKIGAAKSV